MYLTAVYNDMVATAKDAIDSYLVNKASRRRWARQMRSVAILFAAIDGLVPLIVASKGLAAWTASIEFSQFGYIPLALAGAGIGLEKYSGYSSAWIHYQTTATLLQRLLRDFCLDWAVLDVYYEGQTPQPEPLPRRIRPLISRLRGKLDKGTSDWGPEYRSALAEMEKSVGEQLDANCTGRIGLTVTTAPNVADDGITVLRDLSIGRRRHG